MPSLLTPRLELVPVSLELVLAVLAKDKATAEALVGAAFPADWPNDDLIARAFPVSLDAIRAAPAQRLWGDTMLVAREGPRRVVGSVIFHGQPTDGVAEVGYGVDAESRGIGLATEGARACVDWALAQPEVRAVQATTFAWHLASLGVIRNLGMAQVGVRDHDTLGELLVFEKRR